jgi:hypothetical protein
VGCCRRQDRELFDELDFFCFLFTVAQAWTSSSPGRVFPTALNWPGDWRTESVIFAVFVFTAAQAWMTSSSDLLASVASGWVESRHKVSVSLAFFCKKSLEGPKEWFLVL